MLRLQERASPAGIADFSAHLFTVAGSENAKLKRDTRVEIVALHIYEVAYRTMEVVTRRMVDRELERLRAHEPGCRCNQPCGLARQVSPSQTYWTARTWQNSITTRDVHGAGPRRRLAQR